MIANVTVCSKRYILTRIYSVRGDALSASRAQYGAMEKWVPCQEDTRKRKAVPHKFSDTAFRAPSPHPVTNQGGFQYFTLKPQRSGTKKPKQVPPPEAVERGNAETLAWVPYPPPLPSAFCLLLLELAVCGRSGALALRYSRIDHTLHIVHEVSVRRKVCYG